VLHFAQSEIAESGAFASLSRLGLCFTTGVLAFVLRDQLPIGLAGLMITGGAYVLLRGTSLEIFALIVLTAYLSAAVASIPFGRLAQWTRETDTSYGTYIYGWPVMQLVVAFIPGLSQMQLFALTLALLVPIAYLSWRFIEKPALSFKRRPVAPQLGQLGRKIAEPRAPIAPGAVERFDDRGEPLSPPPSLRRINAALRVSTRDRLRVVKPLA
jgi:peptidoglycan/LPS O-acetylase OafA/YrhL